MLFSIVWFDQNMLINWVINFGFHDVNLNLLKLYCGFRRTIYSSTLSGLEYGVPNNRLIQFSPLLHQDVFLSDFPYRICSLHFIGHNTIRKYSFASINNPNSAASIHKIFRNQKSKPWQLAHIELILLLRWKKIPTAEVLVKILGEPDLFKPTL